MPGESTRDAGFVPIEIPGDCRELLARQRGVIARRQAVDSGLGEDSVETLLRTGRWRRLQRGVYAAFTGEPSREGRLWAAVLRAGPSAMLSHRSAAELWGLAAPACGTIHVTVPRDSQPVGIPGVAVHRITRARDVRHPSLLPPRTRVEDTALDLGQSARAVDEAFDWLCRAASSRLTTAERLRRAMRERSRMRWRAELLDALDAVDDGVRSNLEHRYVRDVERPHGLPRAARQVRVVRCGRTCYLDNLYEKHLVCVELDGRAAHPPGERWRDFRRDNAGIVDGIITLRFGWSEITRWPCGAAAQVAAVLRQRGWEGRVRTCGPACELR